MRLVKIKKNQRRQFFNTDTVNIHAFQSTDKVYPAGDVTRVFVVP